jgi:phosphonate transport system substrate-binding protein
MWVLRFFIVWMVCIGFLHPLSGVAAEESKREMTLGIMPYIPATKLIAQHAALADYLTQNLGNDVVLLDGEDYNNFHTLVQQATCDILVIPIHWVKLAENVAGYQRIAKTKQSVFATLVVRKDSNIHSSEQLRDLHLALPPSHDIVHYLALQTLRDYGLEQGRNLHVEITDSYNKALNQVLKGTVQAAAIAEQNIEKYLDNSQQKLRIIAASMPMPSFVVMVHPRLGQEMLSKIRRLLLNLQQTETGKQYFRHSGWQGFLPFDNETLFVLDADLLKSF